MSKEVTAGTKVPLHPEEMVFTVEGEVISKSARTIAVELWQHQNSTYRRIFHINRNGVHFPEEWNEGVGNIEFGVSVRCLHDTLGHELNLVSWKYKPRLRNQIHSLESKLVRRECVYLGVDRESVMSRPMVHIKDTVTGREFKAFSNEWRTFYDREGYYNEGESYSMDLRLMHKNLCVNCGMFGCMELEIVFIRRKKENYL